LGWKENFAVSRIGEGEVGREGGSEEKLEDEIVLGFFSFLISVSFVINPVGEDFE